VDNIRKAVTAILDKADSLLTTEPARMIGYGAAVVVFLAAQVISYVKPGLLPPVKFEDALGESAAAVTLLVLLVEAIRSFVYSPATFLASAHEMMDSIVDAYDQGHIEGHQHEINEPTAAQQPEAKTSTKVAVPVGFVDNSKKVLS
jgi:hypothetical protein